MGKRIDLDSKNDDSSFLTKKPHSFNNYESIPEEETVVEDTPEEVIEEVPMVEEETYSETEEVSKDEDEASDRLKKIAKIGLKTAIKAPFLPWIILGLLGLLFLIAFVVVIVAMVAAAVSNIGVATDGYYEMRCKEVTVIMTDKSQNYKKTGTKTYSLDDYLAGVVSAEVGMFNNLEVYKVFAIAARTYLLNNDRNCTIESSDRKQVFHDVTASKNSGASLIYQAVRDTTSQVLLHGSKLYGVEYDAFCSIAVDSNYYTLKQQNQKIPRAWADSQSGIDSSWKQGNCAGNHGRGISQWGTYYLVTQQDYNHEDVFAFYLGDKEVSISKGGNISTIEGLVIKDTTDAEELHESLATVLNNHYSSINALNTYIRNNVNKNGYGTREGVVTAAVSLVDFLYDIPHVRIPYYWGGLYQQIGVNPNFGAKVAASRSKSGAVFNYSGFDCSGFVSWAIKNGGYNFSRHNTASFDRLFSGDSCNITNSSCTGEPGDLINSASCHTQLIVAVDYTRKIYYVAESTGEYGVVVREWPMHSGNCGGTATTKILHMDSFYNNSANVSN